MSAAAVWILKSPHRWLGPSPLRMVFGFPQPILVGWGYRSPVTDQPTRTACRFARIDESMAQLRLDSNQMVGCADNYRKRRRMRLIRSCAVCFSTAALGLALVSGDLPVTACAMVTWFLTLVALGLGVWRDLKSNG